ncbi:MAG TPA: response regulator [Steroidobacteraceae bacterium]|nr:response regulator [Steroidobacteraceae bacterium]
MNNRKPVMVLEDEGPIALYLQDLLQQHGFDACLFSEGEAAIAAAQLSSFSAAIVDLGLPDISGEEVVKAFASAYPWLPILVSTGHDVRTLHERLPNLDNIRVLSKPFDTADFLENMRQLRLVA